MKNTRLANLPQPVSGKPPSQIESLATSEFTTDAANIAASGQSAEPGGDVHVPAYSITRIIRR